MGLQNSQRILVKLIQEICLEDGITFERFSYDWVLRLSKGNKVIHIYGYQFGNNSATAQLICSDKSAASQLLRSAGVPAVPHFFFILPEDIQFIPTAGNWQGMLDLFNEHKRLVCKPNDGTGGKNVTLVTTQAELEVAANCIFSSGHSVALSPFFEVDEEYRVILLDGEAQLVYSKTLPFVSGDGVASVAQLALKADYPYPCDLAADKMNEIPAQGERIALTWKHNLGTGANPHIIEDVRTTEPLIHLARRAVETTGIHFASVDLLRCGSDLIVLEINSGVMMESFARANDTNYQQAKLIYRRAIHAMMES